MGMHIVITGNPVDGLFFYGPFATSVPAQKRSERVQPALVGCAGGTL